jgi:hypothetical protein
VWSDVVLNAERLHLLRLFTWAGLSVIGATLIFVMLAARRVSSPLLRHFGIQMAAWGVVIAVAAFYWWHGLHLRDVSGAARLERLAWVNIGLDVGYVGIGATLALSSRALANRMASGMAGVGAGTGIMVQGLALLLLDLHFVSLVSR